MSRGSWRAGRACNERQCGGRAVEGGRGANMDTTDIEIASWRHGQPPLAMTSSRMAWVRRCGVAIGLAAAALAACNAAPTAPPPAPTSDGSTVIVPFTPSTTGLPLPTLLPTVVLPPTQAGPTAVIPSVTPAASVTATAVPTSATVQAQGRVTSNAVTRAPAATATPAVTATPFPEGVPKVYVTALRVEPASPKADVPGTFLATFQNASGTDQSYKWCVEIWDVEDDKRFGLTSCVNTAMPVGVTNAAVSGWSVKGLGECRAYRGRAVAQDEEGNRAPFLRPDGSILWLDFTVCP